MAAIPEHESEAERTAVISRKIPVPARYLFAAHASADHISRWFGPVGYPVTSCDYDFRVGGRWRMVMTSPDGVEGPPFGGTILDIEPNRRIVYSNRFEDGVGGEMNLRNAGDEMIHTVTFDEVGGFTTVTVSILFATVAMKEEFLGIGMLEGISSGLDQWEAVAKILAA
ncbi:SRPBCC domain-containing protein [Frigidibacter sp. RF13]|uniref:SRPBCC family protein n=1 Tax=Frigidibacter sp. RF13 TaxID=2997340 RepID=UPI00226E0460|nr:SRPBCC domain-containing protein [Frigidibacter sp. RF13]MCY1127594.1 SRPBCC domain-containing protein [Frigidibacter sp. RF13]